MPRKISPQELIASIGTERFPARRRRAPGKRFQELRQDALPARLARSSENRRMAAGNARRQADRRLLRPRAQCQRVGGRQADRRRRRRGRSRRRDRRLRTGRRRARESSAPGVDVAAGPSVWVTRERPKIDRIACPWLIRRFIDPLAVFHFVAAEWVKDVADEMGAIPYDIKDVHYSHRGETCTFDTLISEFGLADPALDHLARIVRGADTARPKSSRRRPGCWRSRSAFPPSSPMTWPSSKRAC